MVYPLESPEPLPIPEPFDHNDLTDPWNLPIPIAGDTIEHPIDVDEIRPISQNPRTLPIDDELDPHYLRYIGPVTLPSSEETSEVIVSTTTPPNTEEGENEEELRALFAGEGGYSFRRQHLENNQSNFWSLTL